MKNLDIDEKSGCIQVFGLIFSGFRINKRIHAQREGEGGIGEGAWKTRFGMNDVFGEWLYSAWAVSIGAR